MKAANFTLQKYFNRIGFTGEIKPALATLREVMKHQLYAVPFENIDVQQGKIVSLNPEAIVEKILGGRGGYCYEVNGLFCMALEAMGFKYEMLAARPRYNYATRRPRTHMVLCVWAEGEPYLCDLGFGGFGLREPLAFGSSGSEAAQGPDRFRLLKEGGDFLLEVMMQGEWTALYSFDLHPQEWIDYTLPNYFNSTSPDTVFTQKKLAIIQNPHGRKMLIDNELKIFSPTGAQKRIVTPDQYADVLKMEFGLRL